MPDYERSTTITTGPDDAFRFLADPRNLPRYVASMVLAQPEQGETVRVAADVQGRREEGEARFRADPVSHRLEWGGEESSGYHGTLQVGEAGSGATVTIRLHLDHQQDEAEINRVLDETVANIRRELG
jgi:hypothetical protein